MIVVAEYTSGTYRVVADAYSQEEAQELWNDWMARLDPNEDECPAAMVIWERGRLGYEVASRVEA